MYIKKKPYIIAEAGVNHNGSLNLAKKLILGAKKAGADAIKFQSFISENLVKKNAPKVPYQINKKKKSETHFQMLKRLELSFISQKKLFIFCKKLNIEFISTPFDIKSALFLKKLGINIFKISSGDLTDLLLHETVSKFNKDVIISTGMSNINEIKRSLKIYKSKKKNFYITLCIKLSSIYKKSKFKCYKINEK